MTFVNKDSPVFQGAYAVAHAAAVAVMLVVLPLHIGAVGHHAKRWWKGVTR